MPTPSTLPVLPTLFISHGSPMIALEPGPAGAFMQALGPALERTFGRPRAVLALSAHTLAPAPVAHVLLAAPQHAAVHDFGGFPQALYRLRYDAPGAPQLAGQAAALLADAGIAAQVAHAGGLDHGIWTVLRHMYPQAELPVLPLSFDPRGGPQAVWALGRALAPLAAQGVLLLGSGSLTHNLQLFFGSDLAEDAPEAPECAAFRAWVAARCAARDWPALLDYRRQAPHAALMHPSDEHWLPLYFAAGAGGETATPQRLHAGVSRGLLAMDSYAFGPGAAELAQALSLR